MLTRIAWRNIWRNKGRSAVVVGAMIVGIWALSFGGSFMRSFLTGYIASSIKHETSNGQVHHPEFAKDQDINFTLRNPDSLVQEIEKNPAIKDICERSIVNGMISSSRQATGVEIIGVDPEDESRVTELNSLIIDGAYFTNVSSNPVLVGEKLAEKLKVGIKSKVVLTFQDVDGNITAARFRVAGIIHASSVQINEATAYVIRTDLNTLLGLPGAAHEIAFTTVEGTDDANLTKVLSEQLPDDKIEYWGELSPGLIFMQQWMGASLQMLIVIIMLALAFGIVNTMLMAVLERIRELGVLMALGMSRGRIFIMIMFETIFLSTVGGPLGLIIGYSTVSYLNERGIDLRNYSEGLEAFGYDSILYPSLHAIDYLQIVIGVLVTACLASLYPAWKAIRLEPVQAIHTI
ncbi:MAG TPA: FtsX-like permease family protein [Cyclobacteriaceae bacterium]|nr:FtsX-like permease family protein [Cyclobacteriaceae bacterium]